MERPIVIAHRGVSGPEPENSLRAFRASLARGIEAIEFDVRRTADKVTVLWHDAEVADLTVADSEYAELVSREPELCRLEEALAEIPRSCLLDVDLKTVGIEGDVLRQLRAARGSEGYLVSSLEDETVARVKAIDASVRVGLSLGRDHPAQLVRTRLSELHPARRLRACGADFVSANWQLLAFGLLGRMSRLGYPVYVWTVNSPKTMTKMLTRPEVAGLITDRPLQALDIRNESVGRR